ncbi:MAG TPA: hypothetical protein V6D15_12295 [Oculatellaceae cyanobacterium]|jgi:hypothetical protein
MNEFNKPPDLLTQLVQETCKYPHNSLERKQGLTKIIFLMQKSGKIWRGGREVNLEHYQEALQENWYFFSRNLCNYDPQKASVITWFNTYLEYKLRDIQAKAAKEVSRRGSAKIDQETGNVIDPIDMFPAPPQNSVLMIKELIKWLNENQKRLSRIHLRDRTEINAHLLISRHLILEETYTTIAQEFTVPIPTLSNFYKDRCLPIIKRWWDEQGY